MENSSDSLTAQRKIRLVRRQRTRRLTWGSMSFWTPLRLSPISSLTGPHSPTTFRGWIGVTLESSLLDRRRGRLRSYLSSRRSFYNRGLPLRCGGMKSLLYELNYARSRVILKLHGKNSRMVGRNLHRNGTARSMVLYGFSTALARPFRKLMTGARSTSPMLSL